MKNILKQIVCLIIITLLVASTNVFASKVMNNSLTAEEKDVNESLSNNRNLVSSSGSEDLDELVDLEITVTIKEIRALDKIDIFDNADFYVKVYINDEDWWTTDVWNNKNYVYPYISNTIDVSDFEENVNIKIQLWDSNPNKDVLCDIDGVYDEDGWDGKDINIVYNLKTGHWRGEDFNSPNVNDDLSGYGRANGCDDNSYDTWELDCELLFDITQNDYDNDGIPYWTEVNIYGTNPEEDDTGSDEDNDDIPIEWEHKWGHYFEWDSNSNSWKHNWIYDPFEWNNHENLDPDEDGLQNDEEYLTSDWGSDPFRQDIFLELDQMEVVGDKGSYVPKLGKEMFRDALAKHNIVLHIDCHEEDTMKGGEIIPFMEEVPRGGQKTIYRDYFLHNGVNKWRQGIFHYGIVVYRYEGLAGFAFSGGGYSYPYLDGILITSRYHDKMSARTIKNILNTMVLDDAKRKAQVYASVLMHETGHVLGINRGNTPGCDNRDTYTPSQEGWWIYAPYRSCMNYRYVFEIVGYSDGSRGENDFDDWNRIDLTRFQG
jgi:hypothetical protein